MSDLLNCPFCGGKAARPDGNGHTWCTEISCGSDAYMSVEAWNHRSPEERDIRNAALEEAAKVIEARLPLYMELGQTNALKECASSVRALKAEGESR